jgi:hypothetical protein
MGLDVIVGVIPELVGDLDQANNEGKEFLEYQLGQFAAINRVLKSAGLPVYEEPIYPQGRAPWSMRIGSYACLHYLRRIAAHLWAGNGLPAPCYDGKPTHDPVFQRYYRALIKTPNLPFAHLSNPADDCGCYLPVPFEAPLEPGFELIENADCQIIGSSFTLLEECAYLADFLELPLNLEPETMRKVSLGKERGEAVWERYGVESFVCSALYNAAAISVELGCALVFC